MLNDVIEVENELRSIGEEKRRVEEQIAPLQQQMSDQEVWLKTHDSSTVGYQDTLEEWLGLEAYVAELHAQAVSLADAAQELMLEYEEWRNPDLLLAS